MNCVDKLQRCLDSVEFDNHIVIGGSMRDVHLLVEYLRSKTLAALELTQPVGALVHLTVLTLNRLCS